MCEIVVNMNRKSVALTQFVTFFKIYPCLAPGLKPDPSDPEPQLVEASPPASTKRRGSLWLRLRNAYKQLHSITRNVRGITFHSMTHKSADNTMLSADSSFLSADNTMLSAGSSFISSDNTMLSVDNAI
jgi:hypothetical protein